MDALDKDIINTLQHDFPVCEHPFAQLAETLNSTEDELIQPKSRLHLLIFSKTTR